MVVAASIKRHLCFNLAVFRLLFAQFRGNAYVPGGSCLYWLFYRICKLYTFLSANPRKVYISFSVMLPFS